jgi:hypothetical protein
MDVCVETECIDGSQKKKRGEGVCAGVAVTGEARGSSVLAERAPSEGPCSTVQLRTDKPTTLGVVASKLGGER